MTMAAYPPLGLREAIARAARPPDVVLATGESALTHAWNIRQGPIRTWRHRMPIHEHADSALLFFDQVAENESIDDAKTTP